MLRATAVLFVLLAVSFVPTSSAWIDPITDCDLPVETKCMYCAEEDGSVATRQSSCEDAESGNHWQYCTVWATVTCVA